METMVVILHLFIINTSYPTTGSTGYVATTTLSTSSKDLSTPKNETDSLVKPHGPMPPSQVEFHTTLVDFFNVDVSPVINKAVSNVVSAVEKGTNGLNQQIGELIKILGEKHASDSSASKNGGSSGSTSDNTPSKNGDKSAHPFPGTIDDYVVLIPIAMGTSRCGGCCTCTQNQMCLFNLYVQLQIITEKYNTWTPPNIFGAAPNAGIMMGWSSKNNSAMMLEMLLSSLGKKRCKSCFLCQQIDKNLKISFMFNTDVLGSLFKGNDKKNKDFMMAYLMNSQGIEQQMSMLPFLLKIMSGDEQSSGSKSCPFTSGPTCNGQNTCPSMNPFSNGCPTIIPNGNCSQNPSSSSCTSANPSAPVYCPSSDSNTCPTTKPANQSNYGIPGPQPVKPTPQPAYGVLGPDTVKPAPQPSYGAPAPSPNPGKKPAYGMSYGVYN